MADPELARVNFLLEYLAECTDATDLEMLVGVAGGRVRWVIDFDQFTLALRDSGDCRYWTVTRGREHLEMVEPSALPSAHRESIASALEQLIPVAGPPPMRSLCLLLQTGAEPFGAICFTGERGHFSFQDARFAHRIAQALAGSVARLRQAATIQRQARQLEAANRAKDDFLAILGHELRNPLAPILLSVELIDRRLGDGAPPELVIIKRQALHLVRLVDDLLDVARLTRGTIELVFAPVETATFVDRALEMASPLIEARRHRLRVAVPPRGLCVNGDLNRLAQVVANLLTNAARYTEPGGSIEVVARGDDGDVVIDVTDDGRGIPSESLMRIFSMFVQAAPARDHSRQGLGLGLAIVRSLTELHGGSVGVTSDGAGCGSTFTLRFPRVSAEEDLAAKTEPPAPVLRAERPRRVMVVDDNPDVAASVCDLLELAGHHVIVFSDGVRALENLDEVRPDVAVLDIGLPVMDGHELAREIRRRLGDAAPVLIALTGYGHADVAERAREAGFDAHFVKPPEPMELLRAVEQASTESVRGD
jgi:signal transduction histidine kinase/ActR/RegA family two-component response regulator